jgi:hypothetical protein
MDENQFVCFRQSTPKNPCILVMSPSGWVDLDYAVISCIILPNFWMDPQTSLLGTLGAKKKAQNEEKMAMKWTMVGGPKVVERICIFWLWFWML